MKPAEDASVLLRVAEAYHKDAGKGVARINPIILAQLGVENGGVVEINGQQDDKAWGYGDRPRSPEEFLERYKALTEALLFNPKIAGFCYTQLYDIEQEVNGLYTFDRQPKFDPAFFFKVNQQKAALE